MVLSRNRIFEQRAMTNISRDAKQSSRILAREYNREYNYESFPQTEIVTMRKFTNLHLIRNIKPSKA